MEAKRIAVVSVPVSDQERAKNFYTEKLGFRVLMDNQFGESQRWVMLGIPGSETAITLVTWFETMPPGSMKGMVIETDNVEEAHATLTAGGVAASAIDKQPWGVYFTIDDPDGNGLVIQQSAQQWSGKL